MADIFNNFVIKAPAMRVFEAVSAPAALDTWWTKQSSGEPRPGAEYVLWFGPEHDWRAVVSRCIPGREFELTVNKAQEDWQGTRVGFILDEKDGRTQARFYHVGWPLDNDHYRVSCYCWPMYLRLLRRYVEHGEVVPYEERLDA